MTKYTEIDSATLSDNEKQSIQDFMIMFRPAMGDVAKMLHTLETLVLLWDGEVSTLMGNVPSDTEIPNETALRGPVVLSRAEVEGTMTNVKTIVSTYNTTAFRTGFIKSAGAVNTIK